MDKALQTQLENIQHRTGRTIAQLHQFLQASGLATHGELLKRLKAELGMGHGDANTVVHGYLATATGPTSADDTPLDQIYAGTKAALRPLHDALMAKLATLGDFEVAPKKTYVSLRRKKQFAMVGPGTKGRLELGLNMRGVAPTDRLAAMPPGGMCQYKVHLQNAKDIDRELVAWVRRAYDAAG